jgi:hypothetical protein
MAILAPVSVGELIDKISILRVKMEKIRGDAHGVKAGCSILGAEPQLGPIYQTRSRRHPVVSGRQAVPPIEHLGLGEGLEAREA